MAFRARGVGPQWVVSAARAEGPFPVGYRGFRRAPANGWNRRNLLVDAPVGEGPLTALHDSASDESEQSLHQFAVWLGKRFEDCEMVGPVDRQQMPRQSALDPRRRVVDRLAA